MYTVYKGDSDDDDDNNNDNNNKNRPNIIIKNKIEKHTH
jgi:hypothetical protein